MSFGYKNTNVHFENQILTMEFVAMEFVAMGIVAMVCNWI